MLPIRLVVTDLDGTLLPRSGRLGQRTRQVLAEVRGRGVHLSIATGRLFHHALPVAAELNLTDPLICCDGALTHETSGEGVDRELYLTHAAAQESFAQLFFYADAVFLLGRDVIYAAPEADEYLVRPWGDRVVRFDPGAELPDGLQALLAFGQDELLAQATRLVQDALPEAQATLIEDTRRGFVHLLVRPRGADKGAALADLRARLAVRPEETLVFGDWPNDLPMFCEAGCSVAPSNAHPSVRKAATYVSAYSSEEECVARELERAIGL